VSRFISTRHVSRNLPGGVRVACVLLVLALACAPPAAPPLGGAPLPAIAVPRTDLPPGHRRIVFRWEYVESSSLTRGDGAVRIAPPDSARLDLFLGAFGSGTAILIGDTLYAPLPDAARNLVPPPTMLWASLGRLAVPAARDTIVRASGDTIRADIGRDPVWRATFNTGRLVRLERIAAGRVAEHVERGVNVVRYISHVAPRRLTLTITRDEPSTPFDSGIWAR
jgi:hypothetical protein